MMLDLKSSDVKSDKRRRRTRKESKDEVTAKIVVRHLPPTLTSEEFLKIVDPLPEYNYYLFTKADPALGPYAFSKAYINFVKFDDMIVFKEKFHGYVFVDSKGGEYPALVEFAPFQKIPVKKPAVDKLVNTIESDKDYKEFLASLEISKTETLPSAEIYLEELEARYKELKANHGCPKMTTPLTEFVSLKLQNKLPSKKDKKIDRRKLDRKGDKNLDRNTKPDKRPRNEGRNVKVLRDLNTGNSSIDPPDINGEKSNTRRKRRTRAKNEKPRNNKQVDGQDEKKNDLQKDRPHQPKLEVGNINRKEIISSTESRETTQNSVKPERRDGDQNPRNRNRNRNRSNRSERIMPSNKPDQKVIIKPEQSNNRVSEPVASKKAIDKQRDHHRNHQKDGVRDQVPRKESGSDREKRDQTKKSLDKDHHEARRESNSDVKELKRQDHRERDQPERDEKLKEVKPREAKPREGNVESRNERQRRVRNRPEIEIYRPRARRSEGGTNANNEQSSSKPETTESSSQEPSKRNASSEGKLSDNRGFKTRVFSGSRTKN